MSISGSNSDEVFTPPEPQREWLVRCSDSNHELAVCAIEASDGEIGITGPEGEFFSLDGASIARFRLALDAAISQAAQDVLTKRPKPLGGKEINGAG